MENQNSNPNSEEELVAKITNLDADLPEADKKLNQKKMIQIGLAATGLVLMTGIFFWIFAAPSPEKKSDKVLKANQGLAQAEGMRSEKELFDQKEKPMDLPRTSRLEETVPGVSAQGALSRVDRGAAKESLDEVHPSKPSGAEETIRIKKPREGFGGPQGESESKHIPAEYQLPREVEIRLSDAYIKALSAYGSDQVVFTRTTGGFSMQSNPLGGVDSSLKNLVDQGHGASPCKIVISAGQEITASLNETLNTDYPSIVKATISSPPELAGAIALLSYNLGNERASAQVGKIILPIKNLNVKAKEITLASVVKNGLPGLGGDINHHWLPQIAAGMANAGLTAGALAYAAKTSPSQDLGTAVMVAPVIQQGVQGVLKPINYFGRERPITVTVPAGTEFVILVTEGFEVMQ